MKKILTAFVGLSFLVAAIVMILSNPCADVEVAVVSSIVGCIGGFALADALFKK